MTKGRDGSNACVNVERGCLSGASGHRPAPGTRANQIRTRPRTSYRPAVRGRSGPATCRHVRPTERNDRATPRGAASRATCTSALCESTCSLLARTSPPSCPEGGTTRVRAARHPHPGLQLPRTPARVEPSRTRLGRVSNHRDSNRTAHTCTVQSQYQLKRSALSDRRGSSP